MPTIHLDVLDGTGGGSLRVAGHDGCEQLLVLLHRVAGVVGLSTDPEGARVGQLDESVAAELGVAGVTVVAVRPDRYIGLRDDRGDPRAVQAYLDALAA